MTPALVGYSSRMCWVKRKHIAWLLQSYFAVLNFTSFFVVNYIFNAFPSFFCGFFILHTYIQYYSITNIFPHFTHTQSSRPMAFSEMLLFAFVEKNMSHKNDVLVFGDEFEFIDFRKIHLLLIYDDNLFSSSAHTFQSSKKTRDDIVFELNSRNQHQLWM